MASSVTCPSAQSSVRRSTLWCVTVELRAMPGADRRRLSRRRCPSGSRDMIRSKQKHQRPLRMLAVRLHRGSSGLIACWPVDAGEAHRITRDAAEATGDVGGFMGERPRSSGCVHPATFIRPRARVQEAFCLDKLSRRGSVLLFSFCSFVLPCEAKHLRRTPARLHHIRRKASNVA